MIGSRDQLVNHLSRIEHLERASFAALVVLEGIDAEEVVEGGGEVAWAFVDAGVVDHVYGFVAPSLMGGAIAPTAVDGDGFTTPDAAFRLNFVALERVGEDVLLEAVPA